MESFNKYPYVADTIEGAFGIIDMVRKGNEFKIISKPLDYDSVIFMLPLELEVYVEREIGAIHIETYQIRVPHAIFNDIIEYERNIEDL